MRGNKKIADRKILINPWAPPLIIVSIVVCIWLGTSIDSPWLAALAAVSALFCATGIIRSISRGLRPVATVFYTFTFAWLGVAPIVQISTGKVAWGDIATLADPSRVTAGLLLILISMVAFFIGAEHARFRAERRSNEAVGPPPSARVRPWALAAIALGSIALLPLAVQANGGIATLFTSRGELTGLRAAMGASIRDIGGPAYALTRVLPSALAITGALLSIYAIRARWTSFSSIKGTHFLALSVATLFLVLFSNPLSNTRFTAAAAAGSILLAWIRPRSSRWGLLFAAAMLTITLLIYPLANAFRSKTFNVKTGAEAFTSGDFDGFQQVINTMNYVTDIGHTWGLNTLSGLGFFIPRSIWTGKAEPASFAIAEHAGYVWTNLSLPIQSEFYLEFGWVGVVVGMAGLGVIAGRLDYAWLSEPNSKLAMIAPYAAFATLGLIRGPIGGSAPIWGVVVVLLVVGIGRGKAVEQIESRDPLLRSGTRL